MKAIRDRPPRKFLARVREELVGDYSRELARQSRAAKIRSGQSDRASKAHLSSRSPGSRSVCGSSSVSVSASCPTMTSAACTSVSHDCAVCGRHVLMCCCDADSIVSGNSEPSQVPSEFAVVPELQAGVTESADRDIRRPGWRDDAQAYLALPIATPFILSFGDSFPAITCCGHQGR